MKKLEEIFYEDEHASPNSLNFSLDSKIVIQRIKSIVLTIIICIGIIGNSFNLIIFGKKSMRKVATFKYLFVLSINNLLVLCVGASDVLVTNIFQFEIRSYSNHFCKLHTYFTYVVTHSASIILVAVNIERAILMRNADKTNNNPKTSQKVKHIPLLTRTETDIDAIEMVSPLAPNDELVTTILKSKVCKDTRPSHSCFKKNSVIISIILILAFIFLLNSHYVIFLKLIRNSNDIQSNVGKNFKFLKDFVSKNTSLYIIMLQRLATEKINYQADICFAERGSLYEKFLQNIWFWVDMSVYSLGPFVMMCICSLLIVFRFRSMNKNYLGFIEDKGHQCNKKVYLKRIKKNRQICLMLLNSNLYFLLSMLQFWLCFYFFGKNNDQTENLIQLYVYIFLYTNNAIDFLIYGLSSDKYRHELIALFFKNRQTTNF